MMIVMKSIIRASGMLHGFIHQPIKVIWFCLFIVTVSLLLNGSLLRIYGLHRDYSRIEDQISTVRSQVIDLNRQLQLVQDPQFLERQALDRYDLAQEDDLVFIFADE